MNGLQAVTALAQYLSENIDFDEYKVRVFKCVKLTAYNGDYIVVNSLPFTTGYSAESAVLNVNVHVQALTTGEVNTQRLEQLQALVETLIPSEMTRIESQEDTLVLDGCEFLRYCDSNAMADNDKTFFINNKVKVYTYYGS